jgi:hypothetical protein
MWKIASAVTEIPVPTEYYLENSFLCIYLASLNVMEHFKNVKPGYKPFNQHRASTTPSNTEMTCLYIGFQAY